MAEILKNKREKMARERERKELLEKEKRTREQKRKENLEEEKRIRQRWELFRLSTEFIDENTARWDRERKQREQENGSY